MFGFLEFDFGMHESKTCAWFGIRLFQIPNSKFGAKILLLKKFFEIFCCSANKYLETFLFGVFTPGSLAWFGIHSKSFDIFTVHKFLILRFLEIDGLAVVSERGFGFQDKLQ
jgi:hypothetical protein